MGSANAHCPGGKCATWLVWASFRDVLSCSGAHKHGEARDVELGVHLCICCHWHAYGPPAVAMGVLLDLSGGLAVAIDKV